MCTIERFDVVYPDGRRETRERILNCPRGTRTRPCSTAEVRPLFAERQATSSDLDATSDQRYHVSTPRGSGSSRSRPERREKPKTLFDELAIVFKFWRPLSSKKPRKKKYFIRGARPQENSPAIIEPVPRAPSPPPRMPRRGRSPHIVNVAPRVGGHASPARSRERQPRSTRRHRPAPVLVYESSEERDSPSPPTPARDHHRKSRSISPRTRQEAERKLAKDRDRRFSAERKAKAESDAQRRAARVAEFERLERERARRERIEYEERKRIESAERARKRQQREEHEREQAKRRQELEDLERLNAATRHQRRQQEQDRRRREEHERHRWEEQERLARARRANIPRRPRHQPAVHPQGETMEDRGERFIREAIKQENLRQFERQAAANEDLPRRTYDDGGLRRRGTMDGGQGGRYSGQRERRDRRSD